MRLLIVGAEHGLGAAAARAFARHHPVLLGKRQVDFRALHKWRPRLPPVDAILHCSGGGLGHKEPLLSSSELADLFNVNLAGAAAINHVAIPAMVKQRYGRIVHVCSIASGEAVGSVGYNTIKAALAAYVRSLGREMAKYNVVVSGIAPGGFLAPENAMERLKLRKPEVFAEFVKTRLPRGRMGEPEEIMPLIRFLLSKNAGMMAGCVVPIDGGEGHWYI